MSLAIAAPVMRTTDSVVTEAGVPLEAKYLGTRNKDGWHLMEIRIHGSSQVRRYVNPKYVTWKGDAPEFRYGDKLKDFV